MTALMPDLRKEFIAREDAGCEDDDEGSYETKGGLISPRIVMSFFKIVLKMGQEKE